MQTADIATTADLKPSPMLFLKKFLTHGVRVASVMPSSKRLSRTVCTVVDSTRPQTIVELGAGTGAITSAALSRMHRDSRLICFEMDDTFVGHLRAQCPRAEIVHSDVRHMESRLTDLGVSKIDLVLNCLPTPSLPFEINRTVFECIQKLGKNALISQLTVLPFVYWPLYRRLYQEVQYRLVVSNFPPGGAYYCRGIREDYLENLPKSPMR